MHLTSRPCFVLQIVFPRVATGTFVKARYYATNGVGRAAYITTDAILLDDTPPLVPTQHRACAEGGALSGSENGRPITWYQPGTSTLDLCWCGLSPALESLLGSSPLRAPSLDTSASPSHSASTMPMSRCALCLAYVRPA